MPRLFVDTDTASDAAVALIMALRAPGVQVDGISTVAGNVDVAQATRKALTTVERYGAAVPVGLWLDAASFKRVLERARKGGVAGGGHDGLLPGPPCPRLTTVRIHTMVE